MKERPILFSAPMVRAILQGQKTQTRRIAKLPRGFVWINEDRGIIAPKAEEWPHYDLDESTSPYGRPGDRLWVRETFAWSEYAADHEEVLWRADSEYSLEERGGARWRPSIHMPRWASRITLEITGVRAERLNEISETDALAEGIELFPTNQYKDYGCKFKGVGFSDPRPSFSSLWQSINGYDSWTRNPWVWVIEFKRAT